jgi:hypothetical protein
MFFSYLNYLVSQHVRCQYFTPKKPARTTPAPTRRTTRTRLTPSHPTRSRTRGKNNSPRSPSAADCAAPPAAEPTLGPASPPSPQPRMLDTRPLSLPPPHASTPGRAHRIGRSAGRPRLGPRYPPARGMSGKTNSHLSAYAPLLRSPAGLRLAIHRWRREQLELMCRLPHARCLAKQPQRHRTQATPRQARRARIRVAPES